MKFIVDVNLSPKWSVLLEQAGHEATHWSEVGQENAPDSTIAAWALGQSYVVLTADLDFGALLAKSGASRPSVVLLRSKNTRHTEMGHRVVVAVSAALVELTAGALVTLDERHSRIKLLPFEV